jgi:hypothetical protein
LSKKKKNDRPVNDSSVNIGNGNTFRDAAIGEGATLIKDSHIVVDENSKSYEVAPFNASLIEFIAKILINKLGEKGTLVVDIISLLGVLLGIPIGINSFLPIYDSSKSSFGEVLPQFPQYAMVIFVIGIISLFLFCITTASLRYYRSSRCENCNRDFAYQEYKPRTRRDVDTVDAVHRVEKIFLKCRYCGYKTVEKRFFEFTKEKSDSDES